MSDWLKQDNEPLFKDLLWSRPENKAAAGKLLIIGGHAHDVFAPTNSFQIAVKAGIGTATVATADKLPDQILKSENVVGLASTKSGGLSMKARDEIAAMASSVDVVLWPGSLGRDSESTQLLENIFLSSDIPTVVTGDSLDAATKFAGTAQRENAVLVATMAQLRTLRSQLKGLSALSLNMQLTNLVEILAEMTTDSKLSTITLHENQLLVAAAGKVSTTKLGDVDEEDMRWRVAVATLAAVLMAQFPDNIFGALTSAAWLYREEYV